MKSIQTVNVIKINNDRVVERIQSFPDTPEGNKAAEGKFKEWVLAKGSDASDDDFSEALDAGMWEYPDCAIIICHSTEEGEEPVHAESAGFVLGVEVLKSLEHEDYVDFLATEVIEAAEHKDDLPNNTQTFTASLVEEVTAKVNELAADPTVFCAECGAVMRPMMKGDTALDEVQTCSDPECVSHDKE
jgi:hypothetical protein